MRENSNRIEESIAGNVWLALYLGLDILLTIASLALAFHSLLSNNYEMIRVSLACISTGCSMSAFAVLSLREKEDLHPKTLLSMTGLSFGIGTLLASAVR